MLNRNEPVAPPLLDRRAARLQSIDILKPEVRESWDLIEILADCLPETAAVELLLEPALRSGSDKTPLRPLLRAAIRELTMRQLPREGSPAYPVPHAGQSLSRPASPQAPPPAQPINAGHVGMSTQVEAMEAPTQTWQH